MPEQAKPLLEFKNVNLRFGEKWALKDVSFALFPGESRIIFGAAGSGKTTLLKAVVGLVPVDSGEVCLFGQTITRMSETELFALRSKAGFLFQEGGLFDSLTIGENVEYPLLNRAIGQAPTDADHKPDQSNGTSAESKSTETRVKDALRFVELEKTIKQFPSEVSGGMRRRVGIARAVVTEPPLVLYDSPTAGLDPITANTIMALLAKERDLRDSASLIVTHRYQDGEIMSNFQYVSEKEELEPIQSDTDCRRGEGKRTRFWVMKDGEIVFSGSLQELETSQDQYVRKFIRREI